jgi:type IV secretory pathway VirB2 component (pilin)
MRMNSTNRKTLPFLKGVLHRREGFIYSSSLRMSIAGVAIFMLLITIPLAVHAAEPLVQCGNSPDDLCGWGDLIVTLQRILNFVLLYIALPIGVIIIIVGGANMIFSFGNEAKFKKGRQMVTGVAIGVGITFVAWLVVETILTVFFKL